MIQDTIPEGQDTMVWPALRAKADWLAPYDYNGTTPGGNVFFWNGDDAISLQKLQPGGSWKDIDIFGEIGVRPVDFQGGTTGAWTDTKPYWRGDGAYLTKDQTLIRKHTVAYGIDRIVMNHYGDSVTNGFPHSFNAFVEYDSMPANFFDSLGSHWCDCSNMLQPVIIGQPQNQTVCNGANTFFSIQVSGVEPIFYQWQKNRMDINNANENTFSIYNVRSIDQGLYRCIASNAYGADTSYEAVLTVWDSVPPSQIFGPTTTEEFEISTYSVSEIPYHTYVFSVEGGSIISSTNNSITVQWGVHGLGCVSLIEMSPEGCFGDTIFQNINITVHQTPIILENPLSQSVCESENIVFEVFATGVNPLQYQWQKDGIDILNANDSVYWILDAHSEDQAGYRCIVSNNNGADTSETAYLTVLAIPPATISGPQYVDEYEVAVYSVYEQQYHEYDFSVTGGNEIDQTSASVTVQWLSTGYGYIFLVETNNVTGCIGDTVTVEVSIGNVGINYINDSKIKIYPNPTTGNFILDLMGGVPAENITVDIYGIWGEKVLSKVLNGDRKHEFSLSDRPTGVYFIRIITGDKAETLKIIKQ